MIIYWSDKFLTGHGLVDHQHQSLFQAINEFDEAFCSGADSGKLDELLAFLDQYVEEHFTTEESLMVHMGFPEFELHIAEHKRLLLEVKFIEGLRAQDHNLVHFEGMSRFLADWLENHILVCDMALFDFLRKHSLEA